MSFRRMMLATLGAFVQGLIDAFKIRVAAAYGIFEAESCLKTQLDAVNDIGLLQDATIVITPNGYNEDILHTVKGNPITTPYNLSQYTESIGGPVGSAGINTQLNSTEINPFGVAKSTRFTSNASNTSHRLNWIPGATTANNTYTFSVYLKKGIGATAPDNMQLIVQRGGSIDVSANFNLITGVTTNPINCTSSINNTGLTAGWWRCILTFTTIFDVSFGFAFINNNPLAGTAPIYVDAVTSDVLAFGHQLEVGSVATTYQPILFTRILERGYAQHTRSTTGYRVESTGLVREVPQENLLAASENMFLSTVTKSLLTVVANTEQSPIANAIPMLLNDGTGVGRRRVANTTAPLISIGEEFMLSVYAKKAQHDWIQVTPVNANYNFDDWANFNLSTGTIGNKGATGTAYIESIGNGWYRCSVLCRAVGNVTQQIDVCQSIGNVNGGRYPNLSGTNQNVFYICGNTFTRGNTVKPYYPTTLRTNTPRIDYTDGSCPTLLLEQTSTNLLVRSEEFNDAGWIKSNVTVNSNTEIAPNGLMVADTITATSNNGYITRNSASANANNNRVNSIYLKRKTGTGNITLEILNTTLNVSINSFTWTRVYIMDLGLGGTYVGNGTTITATTTTPHNLITGDFIRFFAPSVVTNNVSVTVTGTNTFTFASTSATSNICTIYPQYFRLKFQTSGDEVYAWGAQCELSATTLQNGYYEPTSYIPTTTATVSRATEALNLYKIRDNNLLNNTFSVFWEVRKIGGGGTNSHLLISDTNGVSSTNSIQINGLPLALRKTDNSVNTSLTTPYLPLSTNYYKGLITCNNGVVEIWIDGSKMTTTPFTNYTRLTNLVLGSQDNGISRFKQVLGWNKVLNRAEIDLLFAYPYFNAGYTPVNNELQQTINRANAEGFTIPSTTILGYCDTLITEMKNDGVWNVSDVYFNFAYNDVSLSNWARINWMNPYGGLGIGIVVNLTYQTNGFKAPGAGVIQYFDTRKNSALTADNYILNNAGRLLVMSEASTLAPNSYIDTAGSQEILLNNGTNAGHKINSTNTLSSGVNLDGVGLKSIMRDTSTNVRLQNLSTLSARTQTSTNIPNTNRLLMGSSGFNSNFNGCISNYWIGASLTDLQIDNFRTYYNTYLTNIGLTAYA